jgi:hypothetical protein
MGIAAVSPWVCVFHALTEGILNRSFSEMRDETKCWLRPAGSLNGLHSDTD